ncbi:MAG: helix-turn-helix transcriptional regulator [Betaproteobacteria bacterium]
MASKLKTQFGDRIRQLRQAKGFTSQEAFAAKCGFDRTYISGIERGVRNPSLDAIEIIAKALGVKVSVLFDDS